MGVHKRIPLPPPLQNFRSEFVLKYPKFYYPNPYDFHYNYEYSEKYPKKFRIRTANHSKIPIQERVTYLGVVRVDPNEYVRKHGKTLVESEKLPEFIQRIPTPQGIELAASRKRSTPKDVETEILESIYNRTIELHEDRENLKFFNRAALAPTDISDIRNLKFRNDQLDFIVKFLQQMNLDYNKRRY